MKQSIIADLYKLLFGTTYESDPDNWDLCKTLGKGLCHHHGLYFKEKDEIGGSDYWSTDDVEDHFYDKICPGRVLSLTAFEAVCNEYFDWQMWGATRFIGKGAEMLGGIKRAIDEITESYKVEQVGNKKIGVRVVESKSKAA